MKDLWKYRLKLLLLLCGLTFLSGCEFRVGPVQKTVFIAPQMIDCTVSPMQKCFLVKESPEDEYSPLDIEIKGFVFEPGYEYTLLVDETTVFDVDSARTELQWRLREIVSQIPTSQSPQLVFNLEGPLWVLMNYMDEAGALVAVPPGTWITAKFLVDQISGFTGCNDYFATYQEDGGSLHLSSVGSTDNECTNPTGVMDLELDYLLNLEAASSYQISDNRLKILDDMNNTLLVYGVPEIKPIIETDWKLLSYRDNSGELVLTLEGVDVSANFETPEILSGSAGCNMYKLPYSVEEGAIRFGSGTSSRLICLSPEGVMEQEKAYLEAFDVVGKYILLGDRLVLLNADTEPMLIFGRQVQMAEIAIPTLEVIPDFVGKVWYWRNFIDVNQSLLVVDPPGKYSLEFLNNGQVNIQADCNQANGIFVINGNQLELRITSATQATCQAGSLSEGYIRLLSDAIAYRLSDEMLILDTLNETGRMIFNENLEVEIPLEKFIPATPTATITPLPTLTPSPTPTQTPTTTPTLVPDLIFTDDFLLASGWSEEDYVDYRFARSQGAYIIFVNVPDSYVWSVRNLEVPDVIMEVDAGRLVGSDDGYYGLVCRFQDGKNYYAFLIGGDGSYGIARRQAGEFEFLARGNDPEGVQISRNGYNRLHVSCIGRTLVLYANDHKLLEVQDGAFTDGKIGLIAITRAEIGFQAVFDNFSAYTPK